jgi:opacity protein-like surface antigen
MGIMAGPASNNASQQNIQVLQLPTASNPIANKGIGNPKSTQFGSRLFLGYKFNQYAGFEWGFTYFSGIKYTLVDSSVVPQPAAGNTSSFTPVGGTTARVRGLDMLFKLDYSLRNTIGLFGKAGVAALYTTTPGALNVTNYKVVKTRIAGNNRAKPPVPPILGTETINSGQSTYLSKLTPTFTIGASYDLDQSWVVDVSATRLMVSGVISSMNFYALGISYHFVDKYCGQFLC